MAASFKADVAPAVLAWARKSAGLRTDEVAKKIKVADQAVRDWEGGADLPTLAQLRKLAEIYRRPLSVLLLAEPPKDGQALRDFRSPGEIGELSPALRLALRVAHERREVAVELGDAAPDVRRFDIVRQADEEPEALAARIREALSINLKAQRELSSASAALTAWRGAAEDLGILVFGFSGVDAREARGFSLSEQPFPVVGLNNKDAPNGRTFSLMHELAHLSLRTGESLCDLTDDTPDPVTERYCNHVAGAVLVPAKALLADQRVASASEATTWTDYDVRTLARQFQVSREVVLRRLLILRRTSREHYAEWRAAFEAEYRQYLDKMDETEGGPTYTTSVLSKLGRLYPRLVLAAHDRDAITTSSASAHLGVKVKHFQAIADVLGGAP